MFSSGGLYDFWMVTLKGCARSSKTAPTRRRRGRFDALIAYVKTLAQPFSVTIQNRINRLN